MKIWAVSFHGMAKAITNKWMQPWTICVCAIVITSLNTPIMISNRLMTLQLNVQRNFVKISISISYSGLIFEWNKQYLYLLAKLCCHDSVLTPVQWMWLCVSVCERGRMCAMSFIDHHRSHHHIIITRHTTTHLLCTCLR